MMGYYGVAFPVGIPLMFAAKLGITGNETFMGVAYHYTLVGVWMV